MFFFSVIYYFICTVPESLLGRCWIMNDACNKIFTSYRQSFLFLEQVVLCTSKYFKRFT